MRLVSKGLSARLARLGVVATAGVAVGGCTEPNPVYCDEATPCTEASRPYCDLQGNYGPRNTCTVLPDDAAPGDAWGTSDASTSADATALDASSDAAPNVDAGAPAWGTPQYVLNVNTGGADEVHPSATSDQLELYVVRDNLGEYDVWVSKRDTPSEPWGVTERVDSLSETGIDEFSPEPSPNGLELYVTINNLIHRATRSSVDTAWSAPLLQFAAGGRSPALTGDGLKMYYVGSGYSVKVRTRTSIDASWGAAADVIVPGDPKYDSVSVSADDRRLLLSSPVEFGIPEAAELVRATPEDAWGSILEVPTLTGLDPPPRDCDYFADANAMYCAINEGGDFDIYYLERQ